MPARFMGGHSFCRKAIARFAAALALGFINHIALGAEGPAPDPRASHPGRAVYETYCAACHNIPGTRAPALSALHLMSAQSLRVALSQGVMQQQGSLVPKDKMPQLIEYLAADDTDGNWTATMMCSASERTVDLNASVALTLFGVDHNNSRRMTAQQAGLSSKQLPELELAWAIGFPQTTSLRSSPVIIGTTMFYAPAQSGKLLALDINKACAKWIYDVGAPVRSSVSYGDIGSRKALIFADTQAQIHVVDAKSGERIWKANGRHDATGNITGAPVLYKDRIIVPVSSSGVGSGANAKFECCVGHGAVVALDALTGKQLWTAHTMEDAQYTGKISSTGVKLRGPSGAPIWSTPSIDAKRGLIYATTGQNTSLPATPTSDAILAIDLANGNIKWTHQTLANDVWNLACRPDPAQSGPNCPSPADSVLKDYDFGAGAVLGRTRDGKEILLAGQKSGDLWALDPQQDGKLLWRQRFGTGSALGGIHWGLAIDSEHRVFAPINDPHFPEFKDYVPEPGMYAVDIDTGKVLWRKRVTADCGSGRKERFNLCGEKYGLSAAPLVIDKSVVAGALDGRIYIFDAASGDIVWQYDTLRDFMTLNGVKGQGGGIDSHSVFAGSGMLFVASGYGGFRQPPGNVLLAFRPKSTAR
jgi:polyvinyl alcohol dehydrogenase (cytochrome)